MHAPVQKLPAPPRPVRSRARRERRSTAAFRPVTHITLPGLEIGRVEPKPRETVASFLRRTGWAKRDRKYGWQFRNGLPTILLVNGEAVLRKQWRSTRISANDNFQFVSRPMGGGTDTKQIVGLVALVAVAAFAAWAGPALFAAGSFAALATTAAIGVGGALLVNALTAPKAGATNTPDATTDQIYSVQAQGNTAKLGQPLPVGYGREKVFPDFAATPFGEFVGNDQYQNILLSIGMGSYDYEQMFVDDTPFWDPVNGVAAAFSSATVRFYEPGEEVTLFPTNVSSSVEVTGQQLPDGTGLIASQFYPGTATTPGAFVGGFIANPSGTLAQSLAVDFVLPGGCFCVDPNGGSGIGSVIVSITAEYRPVNDAGAPLGSFSTLFSVARTYGSTSPIRDSVKVDVSPGRYEVRFRRDDAGLDSSKGSSAIIWAGLRSFLAGSNSFADVSTIAIRIKATESTQGSFKFGVLRTRKLQVWDGDSFNLQATRSPSWAFYDAATNEQYGSGHPISKTDFNAIVNHAAGCAARGDNFDYTFSAAVAVPEALDKILTVSRSKHFWLGDTISIVRDEYRNVPSMLLTDREIVRDTTQIGWTMLGEEDPDAVVIEYIDEDTWRAAQVQYPPDSETFTATNPETKRLDGILNRDHAFREAAFYYLVSIYRRESVTIGTEYEGRAITFGSVLRVQSELPMAYGQGGAVTDVSVRNLTLNPAPSWADAGPYFIRLRRPNGKWFGPVTVTQGASESIAVLDATDLASVETSQSITLANVLLRENGGEDPSFELGTADNQSRLCVVLSGQPNGQQCTLNMVVDDERVHATDLGTPPILPVGQFPSNANLPFIFGLNAAFTQGIAEPKLSASWFPTAGALYYVADVSYDAGNTWIQVYEGQDNKFTSLVTLAALKLRVQAVNSILRGPYASVDLIAPTIVIANQAVALSSLIAGLREQVTTVQDNLKAELDDLNQRMSTLVSKLGAGTWTDIKSMKSDLAARSDFALAQISEVRTVAVDANSAVADLETAVTAEFDDVNGTLDDVSATVTEHTTSIATLDGYAAGSWGVVIDVNGKIVGAVHLDGSAASSVFDVLASTFRVSQPGSTGGASVPVFTIANVGGTPKIVFTGDMIGDGTITVAKMFVGSLSAITANMGSITAGTMQDPAGKMLIDLTNKRIVISD